MTVLEDIPHMEVISNGKSCMEERSETQLLTGKRVEGKDYSAFECVGGFNNLCGQIWLF